jgi:hypothetical protein
MCSSEHVHKAFRSTQGGKLLDRMLDQAILKKESAVAYFQFYGNFIKSFTHPSVSQANPKTTEFDLLNSSLSSTNVHNAHPHKCIRMIAVL